MNIDIANQKPIINVTKDRCVRITVMNVFTANFNDTYYLKTVVIDLETLDKDRLTWFDPYCGRSKIGDTSVAIAACSDDQLVLLEKRDGKIEEHKSKACFDCIFSEKASPDMLLASHITLTSK